MVYHPFHPHYVYICNQRLFPHTGTYDVSAAYYGPDTTATTATQSGNTILASSGVFYEDYYWDSACSALGGQYLDASNGHYYGDYGYHYHTVSGLSLSS